LHRAKRGHKANPQGVSQDSTRKRQKTTIRGEGKKRVIRQRPPRGPTKVSRSEGS